MIIESAENLWDSYAPRTMADMVKDHESEIENKDCEIDELNIEISSLEDSIDEKDDEIHEYQQLDIDKDSFRWFEAEVRDVIKTLDPLDDLSILLTRGVNDIWGG